MSDRTAHMEFGLILDGIRTELAGVISRIDSTTKYEVDGAITPESIVFDAEEKLARQEEELDLLYERVLGDGGVVSVLESMTVPPEYIGDGDGSSGGGYV